MPPVAQRLFSVNVAADTALIVATETVVALLPGVSIPDPTLNVHLEGDAEVTTGVGATTVTLRIRRTSLTGALVGEANAITSPASTTGVYRHEEDDVPGDVASLVYVLTATAAGIAGTAIHAYLKALVG